MVFNILFNNSFSFDSGISGCTCTSSDAYSCINGTFYPGSTCGSVISTKGACCLIDRENKKQSINDTSENMHKTFTKGTKIEWTANDKTISKEYTVKKGDKGTIVGQEGTGDEYVVDFEKRFYANTASFKVVDNMNESLINIIKEELLNEVTYHKFKNEVKFRTKNEQLHKAIREVKRKLSEIDRIVEYTSRMKQELSEGEEGIKYWKATSKNVATISEMVNQLNNKIKNLQ